MKILPLLMGIATTQLSFNAIAAIEIKFLEGAPKDRFVVLNNGTCDLSNFTLAFDLTNTRGELIFDTTADGAGVEVFQPFETQEKGIGLVNAATVVDGDKALSIYIESLPAKNEFSFTIDVDDTLANSDLGQIRVTDAEMQNGRITLTGIGSEELNTIFDASSTALIDANLCKS